MRCERRHLRRAVRGEMLAFVAVSRFGQVLTANNINNTKACQHLTTLRMFLNTKRTLGPKVNVILLYQGLYHPHS